MSRHEGVRCDSCSKGDFRGRRYKCLICYDYDLCSQCYENGATTKMHTTDHPMQCIITRSDFDIYYGGEALAVEQPQAFSCPFCSKMGFSEATLQEHVTTEHADSSTEVVCPICASLPGGEPNYVTDDFAAHLTLEHRAPRDFDDPAAGSIRHVRRIPHPARGVGSQRARRNMHFPTGGLSSGARETMDPIAELLSQLSSVRHRAAAAQSVSSQLQQLEMQLQSTRQQLERLPRRATESRQGQSSVANASIELGRSLAASGTSTSSSTYSQFLLARCNEPALSETELQGVETERADRSLFVQELLLATLTDQLKISSESADAGGQSWNVQLTSDPGGQLHVKGEENSSSDGNNVKQDDISLRNKSEKEPPPH